MGHPQPLFVYFRSLQTIKIYRKLMWKFPPSIWHWDSNSQPSDYESPQISCRWLVLIRVLWCTKQLLCQLRHNQHCPTLFVIQAWSQESVLGQSKHIWFIIILLHSDKMKIKLNNWSHFSKMNECSVQKLLHIIL